MKYLWKAGRRFDSENDIIQRKVVELLYNEVGYRLVEANTTLQADEAEMEDIGRYLLQETRILKRLQKPLQEAGGEGEQQCVLVWQQGGDRNCV